MCTDHRSDRRGEFALVVAGLLLVSGTMASAAEVVVKNDSVTDFDYAVIVGDFVMGEQAGARLTSPCNGYIVAVQVLWLEGTPGHGESLEQAIHIYDGATFPTPGAELALLEGPVMTPGYMNEFWYLDETPQFPIHVPVTNGQQFYVTFQFENPTDVGNGGPSVVRDISGCQAGKNVIYAIPPSAWFNACSLGVQGDFVIRAIVDCAEPTGACCSPTGACENGVAQSACQGPGQVWSQGQTCAQVTCNPRWACCHADGTCQNGVPQTSCGAFGDTWNSTQSCAQITCNPRGACCRAGGCLQLVSQATCEGPLTGVYAGNGTDCNNNVCVTGACCLLVGDCLTNLAVQCAAAGGTFRGPGTTCTPNPCPQPDGACCLGDYCLDAQKQANCVGAAGEWAGPFTLCPPVHGYLCPVCADGDLNQDGDLDLTDFADFQTCFHDTTYPVGCNCADMDDDNDVDLADYKLFQAVLATGGPH